MKLSHLHKIYLIGIGGIGMSALARYFLQEGKDVAGYDRTCTELTSKLQDEGINIHYIDDIHLIPKTFTDGNKTKVLVIYTPAIPSHHNELNYFKEQGYQLVKRAEVLGWISSEMNCIAIAGTHGKTTTSSMVAHLLYSAKSNMRAFLGGIAVNYNSNYLSNGEPKISVVEADEYDRSFLQLHPQIAIITSADSDHLDIYGDESEVKKSFSAFAHNIENNGLLIIRHGLQLNLPREISICTYGLDENADVKATNIRIVNGVYVFDVESKMARWLDVELHMGGLHNIENATAAMYAAFSNGISISSIKENIGTYRGVNRRFEFICQTNECIYIDDYAHHPAEIKATVDGIRQLFPGKRILGIFQPHLYSRTRDFASGFADSLSLLDEVILMQIYPARELPIPGVTEDLIFEKITQAKKVKATNLDVIEIIKSKMQEYDIVVTMGAGDIDRLVAPIKKIISQSTSAVS
ncbi:MAG: UDP-N-acetylmuramate--L-alanine ligase [Candidatus Competibacteraceae bacterium]|nr:UDP-N-acetylmuramate--L-alanine ligase [Candidatus Competibacteraceae bacterium]